MMEKIKFYVTMLIFMATLILAGYFDGEVANAAIVYEYGTVFDGFTVESAGNFWGYDTEYLPILPHSNVVIIFDDCETTEIEDDIIVGVIPLR